MYSVQKGKYATVALVGETNVNRDYPASAFENARQFLRAADFRVGHMETLLSASPSHDPERPDIPYKPLWRNSLPENVEAWSVDAFGTQIVDAEGFLQIQRPKEEEKA